MKLCCQVSGWSVMSDHKFSLLSLRKLETPTILVLPETDISYLSGFCLRRIRHATGRSWNGRSHISLFEIQKTPHGLFESTGILFFEAYILFHSRPRPLQLRSLYSFTCQHRQNRSFVILRQTGLHAKTWKMILIGSLLFEFNKMYGRIVQCVHEVFIIFNALGVDKQSAHV